MYGNLWVPSYKYGAVQNLCNSLLYEGIVKKMPPIKADAAFVWRQFIDLGRSNCKKSKRYRCRHCQKEFAATSVGRPKEHLAACDKWQAKQRQERQARDNAGYLPSYSEAVQKKITEVGIQRISQDESRSFAYDAAAAVIAGGRPFSLFESRRWRYFFTRIKPGWKPPSRAVITRILPDFYQEIYEEYNSFFSLLRSRDPARDWSVRKDVRDELRSQDCPVLLPEAVRIIKDNSFWLELEAAIAMLKPVNDFQHVSEADGANVVSRWLQIKSKWAEMGEADQFPDIPWDDIDAIFKARLDKQTYDIHWIADALRPDTTVPNSTSLTPSPVPTSSPTPTLLPAPVRYHEPPDEFVQDRITYVKRATITKKGFRLGSSHLWKYGLQYIRGSDKKEVYYCHECTAGKNKQELFVINGTSKVRNHLEQKHQINPQSSIKKHSSTRKSVLDQQKSAAATNTFFWKDSMEKFKELLIRWIVYCHVAFFQLENRYFRELLFFLNPALLNHLPKAAKTIRSWVMDAFLSKKQRLREDLQRSRSRISISFDLWTSPNPYPILGVIAMWIDTTGKRRTTVLGIRRVYGEHTGENLGSVVLELLKEYDIGGDEIGYFMLDNASSNDTAVGFILKELCPWMD
ncbi:putative AC transposase [Fusarium oxysporum f. sp. raphani]|uniref:Putative AC transposase n=1 Tax=Fusarium oxysporum f. sp. raphani TaxID=96318 RepID=A0A8J5PBV2_FUSOX|nr:putative AC transposase [Fusarium oxysporum f. sp. raphani]